MAPGIADWQKMSDHMKFRQYLQDQHGRKRSFWAQARAA
jgi:hypothetical protein